MTTRSHHEIFSRFTPFVGEVPAYCIGDFIGAMISHEFVAAYGPPCTEAQMITAPLPNFDEEYFEWIDLLEAVSEAQESFTMIELGAGFGRWVVRGGLAARQRNLPFRLVAVEAEPTVYGWLRRHFANNGIDPAQHMLLHGAATEASGDVSFNIGGPRGGEWDRDPSGWYGQHLTQKWDLDNEAVADGSYAGFPVKRHITGWRSISVPGVSLAGLLENFDRVDLIDMDIEGQELPAVTANIKTLDAKVKRLHIGTHSVEIEAGLRELLKAHGWQCKADYSLFSTAQTEWGNIGFENGAQSWVNPRFLGTMPALRAAVQRSVLGKLLRH